MTLSLESKEVHNHKGDGSNKENETNPLWDSLGGMEHIKTSLVEILCWPLKVSKVKCLMSCCIMKYIHHFL